MATPSEQQQQVCVAKTKGFFERLGQPIPIAAELPGFYSDLLRSCLKADRIECGRIICSFVVNHAFTNHYNTLHGGAVGCLADAVTMACAKSVAGDVELFVGETSTAYLSASRMNEEVEIDGRVVRKGRRVIVTSVEFRIKKTRRLLYTNHSTLYIMPAAKL
ncbi:hypothetical protein J5N97_025329 [Dioscorea zingiberensis]|uniref:Thioesterase domain-containing protein n=1 Tax=Dioscorea zingiberensis TaxID=325984 RepID=A0A9D5C9F6_9LILI|nr:hypothetical protein J5N97_025329 [Dioscorea zingiberensis]